MYHLYALPVTSPILQSKPWSIAIGVNSILFMIGSFWLSTGPHWPQTEGCSNERDGGNQMRAGELSKQNLFLSVYSSEMFLFIWNYSIVIRLF